MPRAGGPANPDDYDPLMIDEAGGVQHQQHHRGSTTTSARIYRVAYRVVHAVVLLLLCAASVRVLWFSDSAVPAAGAESAGLSTSISALQAQVHAQVQEQKTLIRDLSDQIRYSGAGSGGGGGGAGAGGGQSQFQSHAVVGNTFFASLPVFRLDAVTKKMVVPAGVTRLIIDVGTFDRSGYYQKMLDEADLMVVGFEPSPASIFTHFQQVNHPRFILIPMAVADASKSGGFVSFGVSEFSQCNSVAEVNHDFPSEQKPEIVRACLHGVDRITVGAIPMAQFLELIPDTVTLELLKVDAQGADLMVIKSAGALLRKAKSWLVECQDLPKGDPKLLYEGASLLADVRAYATAHGYVERSCDVNNHDVRELNCVYDRVATPTQTDGQAQGHGQVKP